ncbi:MAG TPA: hypothetical protein PLR99_11220, partial [Polyangiaceae bacterium]|nr:hypothetical protein [Polyangiaceae bacterium]
TPVASVALPASAPSTRPLALAPLGSSAPPPPELRAPSDAPVCTFSSELWEGEPLALQARPDGEPFGSVATARLATAHVLPSGGWLEVDTGQSKLRGHFRVSAPFLHPTRPLLVGGVLVTTGASRLSVHGRSGERGDRLLVSAAPPLDSEFVGPATVEATCADLSLDPARFDLAASLPSAPSQRPLPRASLVTGRPVLVSAAPGGPARLRVLLQGRGDRDDEAVTVLARRGGLARIVWRREEGAVFGWVSATDLMPAPAALAARRTLTLAEIVVADPEKARPRKTTARSVARAAPLVIEGRDGARVTVGHVTSGAVLGAVLPAGLGPTEVDVAPLGLSLRSGARAYLPGGLLREPPAPAPAGVPAHDGSTGRTILALARRCHDGPPGSSPAPGTLVVRVAVDAAGRVDAVKVSADPSLGGELPSCLAAKLRAATLSPGEPGAALEARISFTP